MYQKTCTSCTSHWGGEKDPISKLYAYKTKNTHVFYLYNFYGLILTKCITRGVSCNQQKHQFTMSYLFNYFTVLCKVRKTPYGWSAGIREERSKKGLAEILF
jgi:hypothetical protein